MSGQHQTPTTAAGPRTRIDLPVWAVVLILLGASVVLWLTAPTGGDFSWSDAPRHALNGAFVLDLIRAHPWRDPAGWAMQYYIRYPSLTILFYPPFFYVVEAIFYAALGVSHAVAQLAENLFVFLLGLGAFAFARLVMGRIAALGVALMLIGAPEVAFWGRQVMLDVPSCALGLLGMYALCRWLRDDKPVALYLAAAALLAAIYTKYNVAFLLPAAAGAALAARGWRVLLNRHVWIATALALLAALPAVFIAIR
ncbi:MAG TPA: glycosyltransferase family 39 protein, partial [Rhodopila sp.]|nr:glycosyltransferase family 39 protein [Rhodopila sp.]